MTPPRPSPPGFLEEAPSVHVEEVGEPDGLALGHGLLEQTAAFLQRLAGEVRPSSHTRSKAKSLTGTDVMSSPNAGATWPAGRIAVFAVTGSCEGHYIHVEVLDPDGD